MKKYFIAISVFALISFVCVGLIGRNKQSQYSKDFLMYKDHMNLVEQNKDLDKALKVVEYMQSKEENENYIFNIDKASIYEKMGKNIKAQEEYSKAVINAPILKEDVIFLIDYANVSLINKDLNMARDLMKTAHKLGIPKDLQKKSADIMNNIK